MTQLLSGTLRRGNALGEPLRFQKLFLGFSNFLFLKLPLEVFDLFFLPKNRIDQLFTGFFAELQDAVFHILLNGFLQIYFTPLNSYKKPRILRGFFIQSCFENSGPNTSSSLFSLL